MDYILAQEMAVQIMHSIAKEKGLVGVAGALVLYEPDGDYEEDYEVFITPTIRVVKFMGRDPESENCPEDIGVNYIALAFSMLSEMLSSQENSGTIIERLTAMGEFGLKGGIAEPYALDTWVYTFFYGEKNGRGQDNLNMEVAEKGMLIIQDILKVMEKR